MDLPAIQQAIRQFGFDGWLLYDFRGLNVLARRVVGFGPEAHFSRRWFYFIPAQGEPRKLVHRIEPPRSTPCPAPRSIYLRWQELEAGVKALVQGAKRVAMEYVPRNANPYVSRVDAGTVELVQSFGVEVVPSGDLMQLFEACWDDEQWAMHLEAAKHTRSAYDVAFGFIAERVRQERRQSARPRCSSASSTTSTNWLVDRPSADRARRPAQRRPALRADARHRRARSAKATSCSSTCGPSSTSRGPSTAT